MKKVLLLLIVSAANVFGINFGDVPANTVEPSSIWQASSANLTTWSGIAPGTNVGTFLATPSSANLRAALTDENGTGAALFSGATTPDFTTGFTIGGAAASGKILVGNGTNYVASTPTYPNAANPTAGKVITSDGTNWVASTVTFPGATATLGKVIQGDGTNWVASTPAFPTTTGSVGYNMRSDGSTGFATYPMQILNSSTTDLTVSTADIYLAGSNCPVAAGDMKAKGQYRCSFDMTKTAGTGAPVISVRIGTLGTTGDTAQITFTFGAGTSVADTGTFEVYVVWRSVGSGTSAVVSGFCRGVHNLATTGLFSNAADWVIVGTTSAGFNSSAVTTIGCSFNGGTAFAGTNKVVQASLQQ
jgi:hypothetical protein